MSAAAEFLRELFEKRAPRTSSAWLEATLREVQSLDAGNTARFPTLISLASRHAPRGALEPTSDECSRAFDLVEGWTPERWTMLDVARARLVLARRDIAESSGAQAVEECFRYADVGELAALYRSLALLPDAERFRWRAGEGCRSSMRVVFEAAACDTPFPFLYFDDPSWRQMVIKALFVEAPLWRVHGLDRRLDSELARMALDLADERRSAGRSVQTELWLVLGRVAGDRGRAALELELAGTNALGRRAAAVALARSGEIERLAELHAREPDPAVRDTMRLALAGRIHQGAFKDFDPTSTRS